MAGRKGASKRKGVKRSRGRSRGGAMKTIKIAKKYMSALGLRKPAAALGKLAVGTGMRMASKAALGM